MYILTQALDGFANIWSMKLTAIDGRDVAVSNIVVAIALLLVGSW